MIGLFDRTPKFVGKYGAMSEAISHKLQPSLKPDNSLGFQMLPSLRDHSGFMYLTMYRECSLFFFFFC
jgi:hypothetical protein